MMEKKRLRELSSGIPKYKYLIEATENLVKSVQFGATKSIYQTDAFEYELLQ